MSKSVILTGATSGLGLDIKGHLTRIGYNVISISRRSLEDPNHYSCDISDYKSLNQVYLELLSNGNKYYALINCAGIAAMNLALAMPSEDTQRLLTVNLQGTMYSNQIFAPLLIRNGGGRIINFSSIAVQLGLAGESVYIGTKAGVEGFSRALANELSQFGITVNCIAPGPIKTNMIKDITDEQIKKIISRQIIEKIMSPSDVSELVELLLSSSSKNLTGQVFHLGGV